jgi:MFS family permease
LGVEGLRNRGLLRLLVAQALSSLGTSVSTVALAVMVFDLTGSVLHMGGILAASSVPLVVMSFMGGALIDRFDARRLMIGADLARALLIMAMPFVGRFSVGGIYVITAAMGTFAAVFNPSQVKIVGEITPPGQLVRANSFLSIARDGAEIGGYLAGGLLVAVVGYVGTFSLDSLSYAVSAVLLVGLPAGGGVVRDGAQHLRKLLLETPRTFRFIMASPPLRTNLLMTVFPGMAIMMGMPNAYGLALEVFQRGPRGFAAMEIITAFGWILGGLLTVRLNYKGDRNRWVYASILGMATCLFCVGLSGSFWISVAFLSVGTMANVGVIVGSMTLLQELEPRPDKGRIIALRIGFAQLGATVGYALGGVLGSALGIRNVFLLAGVLSAVLCTAAFVPYAVSLRRPSVVSEPDT